MKTKHHISLEEIEMQDFVNNYLSWNLFWKNCNKGTFFLLLFNIFLCMFLSQWNYYVIILGIYFIMTEIIDEYYRIKTSLLMKKEIHFLLKHIK